MKKPVKKSLRKPSKAKAALKKPNIKAQLKPKLQAKKPEPTGRGFMWRLLERKQANLKQKKEQNESQMTQFERFKAQHAQGFGRFAGPRRKAG